MTDLTQKLPVEILEEILRHVPTPDILRFKQINRVFHHVVLSSPLIRHKIDLYAAGFEYNPAAEIDLAESQKALHQHLSNLDSVCPVQKRSVENLRVEYDINGLGFASGVCAVPTESVRLFGLGSSSRRVSYKEWEIPFPPPPINPGKYGFCPDADLIAFVELRQLADTWVVIHLRSLSSGGFHPMARCPTISHSRKGGSAYCVNCMAMSSSRLAIQVTAQDGTWMVIWDWKSAQVLFVLKDERYHSLEFIDDYRLLVSLRASRDGLACVVLMDTEKGTGGTPAQMTFHLPTCFRDFADPYLLLDRGTHKPTSAECLAPFHQDHTQRIAALFIPYSIGYLVFSVEALLRLAGVHEGCEIGWDEWKKHVVIPSVSEEGLLDACISGCRLFCITNRGGLDYPDTGMEVYDFSIQGRAKYLSEQTNAYLGGVGQLASTGVVAQLPREPFDMGGSCGNVVFIDTPDGSRVVLHIWTF